jgi:hypothetical protein
MLLDPLGRGHAILFLEGCVEDGFAFEAVARLDLLGFLFFYPSKSPSTQADFAMLNYFFRTDGPHFLGDLAKNQKIIQFKV